MSAASLKILPGKFNGTKPWLREKEYNAFCSPWWKTYLISWRRRIPILYLSFSNVNVSNVLVNKSARLSLEWICWTFISPFCWRSCVKKNLGEICFVRLLWYILPLIVLCKQHYLHTILLESLFAQKDHMIVECVKSLISTIHTLD